MQGDPAEHSSKVVIRNTFLEVRSPTSREYRRINTLPAHLMETSTDTSPNTQREDFLATTLYPIPGLCLIWIDDRSFKESGKIVKNAMQQITDSGQVKCYKASDKFLRAYWKKHASHERHVKEGQKIIIICSEEEYDTLVKFVETTTTVTALIKFSDGIREDSIHANRSPRTRACGTIDQLISLIVNYTQ